MRASISRNLHKILYSITANLITLIVSIFLSLIVPKLLGVEQYGYWQLYSFYVGYISFFHLGIPDGLYLRYGGKYYDELNKPLMHSQYWSLTLFEIFVSIAISIYALVFIIDNNRVIILIATGINAILILPRAILFFLLQATGRVKEYARNIIFERLLYSVIIVGFLFFGYKKFEFMLLADILAKIIAAISIALVCKDIVFIKGVRFYDCIAEGWMNITIGIRLLIANIAGMLIIGIVRFSIERVWDVTTFGKVSFSLSISNLILTFISAVSVVIFPIIKRSDQDKLPILYDTVGFFLSGSMVIFQIFYYPIKLVLTLWLPNYAEAIGYFSILFPLSIFEARSTLLINTYLKAFREENTMLWLNVFSVGLSLVVTGIIVFWLKNLIFAIMSIIFLNAVKCFIPDLFLQKKMGMKYSYEVLWDVLASVIFIFSNWFVGGVLGWGAYCIFVVSFLFLRMSEYKNHKTIIKDFVTTS